MRRPPAHAGSLTLWERLAFALAFALMAAFVVLVIVSAARGRGHGDRPPMPADGGRSPRLDDGSSPGRRAARVRSPDAAVGQPTFAVASDRQLAAALAPVLLRHTGDLAVGVIDRTTGGRAIYNGGRRFHAASIVKADILAALLLEHQRSGRAFGEEELELAAQMMEYSNDDAASELWKDVGWAGGVAAADARLGLRHTAPGKGGYWGLTRTTVADQLRLLTDLTSSASPLAAPSRSYELSLMRQVAASQAWGVPETATAGTSSAVKNGWLPDPRLWVVNSIGVIHHAGQELLVAVLSDDQPTESAGIAQDEAAAVAAVNEVAAYRS